MSGKALRDDFIQPCVGIFAILKHVSDAHRPSRRRDLGIRLGHRCAPDAWPSPLDIKPPFRESWPPLAHESGLTNSIVTAKSAGTFRRGKGQRARIGDAVQASLQMSAHGSMPFRVERDDLISAQPGQTDELADA